MAFDFVKTIVTVINNARDVEASGEINKQASDGMFNGLLDTVPNFPDEMENEQRRIVWEGTLRMGEDAWCEENYGGMKDKAQHQTGKRAGEWKYRTLLPNPYTSAKNVIGVAIERGIDVRGMGKSAIQKASKEAKTEDGESLTSAGKFTKLIDKALEVYNNADSDIKERMIVYVSQKFDLVRS